MPLNDLWGNRCIVVLLSDVMGVLIIIKKNIWNEHEDFLAGYCYLQFIGYRTICDSSCIFIGFVLINIWY
jgi:hypothetical protein